MLASAMALLACASPNLYATARTTPPGKVAFTVAPEAIGIVVDDDSKDPDSWHETGFAPVLPSYRVRVGLAERLDAAVVLGPVSAGGELKYNFLKSPLVDLALAPGYQWMPGHSTGQGHLLAVPAVVDLNIHRRATVVLTPGVHYAWAQTPYKPTELAGEGASARFGAGLNLRVGSFLALQPELTGSWHLTEQLYGTRYRYSLGLGINFFGLPGFDDVL